MSKTRGCNVLFMDSRDSMSICFLFLSVLCSPNRPGKGRWCDFRGGERVASIARERSKSGKI